MYTVSPMSLEEVKELNATQLSRRSLGDCGNPDASDSPGALFLAQVRDATLDAIEEFDGREPSRYGIEIDWNEKVTSFVDELIPVYNHYRWITFVDLAAYQEDIDTGSSSDLTDLAAYALEQIGTRLATNIYDAVQRWKEQEAEENELESASESS